MADSIRLAILKQLCSYLQTEITEANGYENTLTGVYRGRLLFGEDETTPFLSIVDALNPDRDPVMTGDYRRVQKENWTLLIQGISRDDATNPSDPAHQLLADTKRALGNLRRQVYDQREQLDGTPMSTVAGVMIEPGTVRPMNETSERAVFWLRITLEITEDFDELFWSP